LSSRNLWNYRFASKALKTTSHEFATQSSGRDKTVISQTENRNKTLRILKSLKKKTNLETEISIFSLALLT
jgi:hypothetical protein